MAGRFERYRSWVDKWAASREYERGYKERQLVRQESKWVQGHSNLITALTNGGHDLHFDTKYIQPDRRSFRSAYWETTMTCHRCGGKYREGRTGRRWGLSSERPCVPR